MKTIARCSVFKLKDMKWPAIKWGNLLLLRRRRRTTLCLLSGVILLVLHLLLGNNFFLTTCVYSHKIHSLLYGPIDKCFFTARSPKAIPVLRDYLSSYSFLLDHTAACGKDSGASLPLLIAVTSGVLKSNARSALRETWGGRARHLGAKMLFFVGVNDTQEVHDRIREEDVAHGDILQANYADTYINLTLKTVSMMKWVSENCGQVRFVLKVDDDMFVNIERVITYFSSLRDVSRTIFGRLTQFMLPFRNPDSKWYVPWDLYPECGFYPSFTRGGAYVFTGDAAGTLYRTSLNQNFLHIEDVSLTGIAAQKAGIPRVHHDEISDKHMDVLSCSFREMMTSHQHKPEEMRTLWKEFSSGKDCDMFSFDRFRGRFYKMFSWLN